MNFRGLLTGAKIILCNACGVKLLCLYISLILKKHSLVLWFNTLCLPIPKHSAAESPRTQEGKNKVQSAHSKPLLTCFWVFPSLLEEKPTVPATSCHVFVYIVMCSHSQGHLKLLHTSWLLLGLIFGNHWSAYF